MALAEHFLPVHCRNRRLAEQITRVNVREQAMAAWSDMAKAIAEQMITIDKTISHIVKCDL
jgi:hypothetical protein